jgi:hypothetical protein
MVGLSLSPLMAPPTSHALYIPIPQPQAFSAAMAIHQLVSMDEFVDSTAAEVIGSLVSVRYFRCTYNRFHGVCMAWKRNEPSTLPLTNSSIDTSGWIALRLKGAWGICSKRACIECRSHWHKDDGAITTTSRHAESMGLTV